MCFEVVLGDLGCFHVPLIRTNTGANTTAFPFVEKTKTKRI